MTPLEALIRQIIARQGPISVARYMALALQHPEHGYYRRRQAIGAAGDFVTAPEVSQMFGELVGLWCADLWHRMGRPDPVRLIELGPGRGTLMADAMRAIGAAMPAFARAAWLHLVEVDGPLRAEQQARLGLHEPHWHDNLGALPDGPALLIANEFFDALPVRQFAIESGAVRERVVIEGPDGGLAFSLAAPEDEAGAALAATLPVEKAPAGLIEVSAEREALAADIARRVAAQGGGALILDYGAASLDGADTLQAVRGHRQHFVLDAPGEADLTSHVDFGALARAAVAAGAAAFGPVEQGAFLERLGIGARFDRLVAGASPDQRRDLASGYRRLVAPDAMGRLFKALAIVHPEFGPPAGFAPEAEAP